MKKYEQVKEKIKQDILDEVYIPNQKIPSESELTIQFEVSRHTVRKAINDLVNEGWLYTEQGSGTYCAERSLSHSSPGADKAVALITTYISNYIFPTIINGMESYLSGKGYTLLLYSTNNDFEKERQCLENVMERDLAGLIVEPTKSNHPNPNLKYYLDLEMKGIPYLMINAAYSELNPYSLMVDDELGGFLQAEHLIKEGHTNIAGLFKTDDMQGVKRMKGFIRAHREYKIPIHSEMLLTYTTREREKVLKGEFANILARDDRPSGICFYNDEVALTALDGIREAGLSVPDDLSIVGFDDSYLATASEVKLTTVKHPQYEMGVEAAKAIIQLIEKKQKAEDPSIVYEPKLVIRQSTQNR
ncbi:substrate-binding domain-containing protein [Pradoshia sp.]